MPVNVSSSAFACNSPHPTLLLLRKDKYKHKHKTQNRKENSSGHISSFSSISQRQRQANTYIPKLSSGHTLAPSPLLHKHKDKTHKTHKAQKGKGYCAGHSGSLSLQAVVNPFFGKKCSFKAPLEIFIIDKMEHHKSCWHISKGGRANCWLYCKVASSAPCYVEHTQRQRRRPKK